MKLGPLYIYNYSLFTKSFKRVNVAAWWGDRPLIDITVIFRFAIKGKIYDDRSRFEFQLYLL